MPKYILLGHFSVAFHGVIMNGEIVNHVLIAITHPLIRAPHRRGLTTFESGGVAARSAVSHHVVASALVGCCIQANPSSFIVAKTGNRPHLLSATQDAMRSPLLHRVKPLTDAAQGLAASGSRWATRRREVVGSFVAPRAALATVCKRHYRLRPIKFVPLPCNRCRFVEE